MHHLPLSTKLALTTSFADKTTQAAEIKYFSKDMQVQECMHALFLKEG
jgi:hypothetical protein